MTMPVEQFALLLAGGRSLRMGRDKAEVLVDGQTLLARTAALAQPQVAHIYVSVRDAAAVTGTRAQFSSISDAAVGEGPLAGILAALEYAPQADWLVLACDLPRLDAATLATLSSVAQADRDSAAIAIRSERDGLPEPMCAIWRAPMIAHIRDAFANQRYCARKCLILADARLLDPVTPGALANMNTEDDLIKIVDAMPGETLA